MDVKIQRWERGNERGEEEGEKQTAVKWESGDGRKMRGVEGSKNERRNKKG